MYDAFVKVTEIAPEESLLDVGVTSDQTYEASNYVEAWYPYKDKITAVGIDDAQFLEQRYPGVTFCRADGRNLPFPPESFDVVHSSAVLEHVGGPDRQREFIVELVRVAKRAIFITTPNRWFPVEFHTVLPLIHWLPKPWFRGLLRNTRYRFFSFEDNLNLLDRREIRSLCAGLGVDRVHLSSHRLLGISSNLLLTILKN